MTPEEFLKDFSDFADSRSEGAGGDVDVLEIASR
jgi:hypothetical protein